MLDRSFSFSARCRTADPVALSAPLSPTYFPESLASPGMEEVVAEEPSRKLRAYAAQQ
jgi:hypothetical protein